MHIRRPVASFPVFAALIAAVVPALSPDRAVAQSDSVFVYQDLAWSPDGSKLAYSAMRISRARWAAESYGALSDTQYDVWVMNADGSSPRRLTSNPGYDLWVAWSPDGRIAYSSTRDDSTDLWVLHADGSGETRLTRDPGRESEPAWSPDGLRIAFASRQGDQWRIQVMRADGSGVRVLSGGPGNDEGPAWSPDGTWIAYYSNPGDAGKDQVLVMRADGTDTARVVARGVFPGWSPDGRTLLYSRGDLWTVGVAGGDERVLVPGVTFGRWSPDGRRLAIISGMPPDMAIWVMDPDGSGRQRLTP